MRQIKFRGYHKDVGYVCDLIDMDFDSNNKIDEVTMELKEDDVAASYCNTDITLMQYTGLKDSNGVEIYEGDIVKNKANSLGQIEYQYDQSNSGFIILLITELSEENWSDAFYDPMGANFYFNELEVIGNIYENPELLK